MACDGIFFSPVAPLLTSIFAVRSEWHWTHHASATVRDCPWMIVQIPSLLYLDSLAIA